MQSKSSKQRETSRGSRRPQKGKNGWSSIWAAYRYRAKARSYDWRLTRAQFDSLIRQPCFYCGDAPTLKNKSNLVTVKGVKYYYSGVDRLNNEPYYAASNARPCCARCNVSKNILTAKEFIEHATKISAHSARAARIKRNMAGTMARKRGRV